MYKNVQFKNKLKLVFTSKEFQPFSAVFDESYKFIGPSLIVRENSQLTNNLDLSKLIDKKVIYVSLGTVLSNDSSFVVFYNNVIKAFFDSDYQVVMSIGNLDKNLLDCISCNFIVQKFVDQLEILKYANVFISHGGINSVKLNQYFIWCHYLLCQE